MQRKINLIERAELIKDLPNQLTQARDIETVEKKGEILNGTDSLAYLVKKALDSRGNFELSVLLKPKGSKIGDPNLLEDLIESIKE